MALMPSEGKNANEISQVVEARVGHVLKLIISRRYLSCSTMSSKRSSAVEAIASCSNHHAATAETSM